MGDFNENPKKPYEVRCPNKIRKRITMHEKHKPEPILNVPSLFRKAKSLLLPKKEAKQKRGSMWSRFTGRIKKFLK